MSLSNLNPTSERDLKSSYLWQCSSPILSFDTVSSKSNKACAEFVANELDQLGFKTQLVPEHHDKYQVLSYIGPETDDGLILSGHMDIVPFESQPGWTKNPLKLTLDDDKVYGRGSSDMKLFMSHCLTAFKKIKVDQLKKPIVCLFTCDEEVGCLGAKSISPRLKPLLGKMPLPKKAVIGEPTGFKIINSHKGIVIFEVILSGKAAHSSRPDWGKNAILPAEKVMAATRKLNEKYLAENNPTFKKLFPDYPFNYLSLSQIKGGIADNIIPDECRMVFSYRPFPGSPLMGLYEELKQELKNFADEIEFNHVVSVPSLSPANNIELIEALKDVTGHTDLHSVSFATDASFISTQDVDCFVCGAGSIEKAHQPDEYMTLSDFLKGPVFIEELLKKLEIY